MTKTRKNNHYSNIKTKTNLNNKTKTKRVFKKNDFYSGDGMVTKIWGPVAWTLLHTISFNYPVKPTLEQKHQYRDFILSLQNVLPCGTCRKNLTTNFKQLPLTMAEMESRDTFSRYIYNLHELVNRMLKKKSGLTYCDVRERYEHFRSRCTHEKPKLYPNFVKMDLNENKTSEKGCVEPLYGKKSKCIIKIVPQEEKGQTMQIDKKCVKTKIHHDLKNE
uniref:thiol oxidase n=1 Tax=viral metagenome TaxID=1070528 RepID=A0A6C0I862_9ZZZZ